MLEKIAIIQEKLDQFIEPKTAKEVENFRIQLLGRKGEITALLDELKAIPAQEKKKYGQPINLLKKQATEKIQEWVTYFEQITPKKIEQKIDFTLPGEGNWLGHRHPIAQVRNEIVDIFKSIGFGISEGPEVEDDWHNFSALNFPANHPARDMQDTFFTDNGYLLRTHTSSVQVRTMETEKPPIRTLSPGRVYRNEAISARSHCIFHQIEGLYIDEKVSFADLKQTLIYFTTAFFGKSKIRLRPSYFPFTEPSAEVDVYWGLNSPSDYRITKGTGWLEIMGCGMVDPAVLQACNIDAEKYTGFAFGMGIERIAMLRYQIPDIRYFFENDDRFLAQF